MSEGGPNPSGTDLADGDITENPKLNNKVELGLGHLAADVRKVRMMHISVMWAAAVPVAVLLWLLCVTVSAFSSHLEGANTFLTNVINAKPVESSRALAEKVALTAVKEEPATNVAAKKDKEGKSAEAKPKAEGDAKQPMSDQAHLYALLSSYQANLSTSSVAVISILVIAIVVITVAVLRSTMAVAPYDPSSKQSAETKETAGSVDEGYAVPVLEFIKNTMEVAISTFKGKKE